jgi:hypothetical protein
VPTKKPLPPKKPEPFDIVICEWEDASAYGSMQVSTPTEAVASYTPVIRRTVGYFVAHTKDLLVLANDDDRMVQGAGALSEAMGGIMYIPAKMVRHITFVATSVVKAR